MTDRETAFPGEGSECARANSSREARFRVQEPNSRRRSIGVVALGRASGRAIDEAAHRFPSARFLVALDDGEGADLRLTTLDGVPVAVADLVERADSIVLVTTPADGNVGAARAIAEACQPTRKSLLALLLAEEQDGSPVRQSLAALRPYLQMLVVTGEPSYLDAVLTSFGG